VLTDAAKKLLADEGYDPTLGARPLKRVIQQRLENPLAQQILGGEFAEGDTIHVDVDSRRTTSRSRSRARRRIGAGRVISPYGDARKAAGLPGGLLRFGKLLE
jgi:hypothetical protein